MTRPRMSGSSPKSLSQMLCPITTTRPPAAMSSSRKPRPRDMRMPRSSKKFSDTSRPFISRVASEPVLTVSVLPRNAAASASVSDISL